MELIFLLLFFFARIERRKKKNENQKLLSSPQTHPTLDHPNKIFSRINIISKAAQEKMKSKKDSVSNHAKNSFKFFLFFSWAENSEEIKEQSTGSEMKNWIFMKTGKAFNAILRSGH